MMLKDTSEKIKRWRKQAFEVRALAGEARDPFRRDHLLKVAETYELVAHEAETRILGKIGMRRAS